MPSIRRSILLLGALVMTATVSCSTHPDPVPAPQSSTSPAPTTPIANSLTTLIETKDGWRHRLHLELATPEFRTKPYGATEFAMSLSYPGSLTVENLLPDRDGPAPTGVSVTPYYRHAGCTYGLRGARTPASPIPSRIDGAAVCAGLSMPLMSESVPRSFTGTSTTYRGPFETSTGGSASELAAAERTFARRPDYFVFSTENDKTRPITACGPDYGDMPFAVLTGDGRSVAESGWRRLAYTDDELTAIGFVPHSSGPCTFGELPRQDEWYRS